MTNVYDIRNINRTTLSQQRAARASRNGCINDKCKYKNKCSRFMYARDLYGYFDVYIKPDHRYFEKPSACIYFLNINEFDVDKALQWKSENYRWPIENLDG